MVRWVGRGVVVRAFEKRQTATILAVGRRRSGAAGRLLAFASRHRGATHAPLLASFSKQGASCVSDNQH